MKCPKRKVYAVLHGGYVTDSDDEAELAGPSTKKRKEDLLDQLTESIDTIRNDIEQIKTYTKCRKSLNALFATSFPLRSLSSWLSVAKVLSDVSSAYMLGMLARMF